MINFLKPCQISVVKLVSKFNNCPLCYHKRTLIEDAGCSLPSEMQKSVESQFPNDTLKSGRTRTTTRNSASSRIIPNHFVAMQITNPKIREQVAKVQQLIVEQNPVLEKANISLPTLHITLAVMHFDAKDEEVLSRATSAMQETFSKIRHILNEEPLTMKFRGLDTFSNKVLFAKIDGKETLEKIGWISRILKETFTSADGVTVKEEELHAHLTIMKLSNLSYKQIKVVRKIDPSLYEQLRDLEFGDETVTSLQLLSMNDPKDADGYYKCRSLINWETKSDLNS